MSLKTILKKFGDIQTRILFTLLQFTLLLPFLLLGKFFVGYKSGWVPHDQEISLDYLKGE